LKSSNPKIIIKKTKKNVPARYNEILKEIDSDFIFFIDGDCSSERHCLEKLMQQVKKYPDYTGFTGNVRNPKPADSKLQELIGTELETRYDNFQEEVSKAPTMNFLVKTELVKKLKFNENLKVSYDADFSFRMVKETGKKIKYVPDAIIYHHHRATWGKYFKQQRTYAEYLPITYINSLEHVKGDSISKPTMMIQPFLLYLTIFSFITACILPAGLSIFAVILLLISLGSLVSLYRQSIEEIKKTHKEIKGKEIDLYLLHGLRTTAWCVGFIFGIINLIKYIFRGQSQQ